MDLASVLTALFFLALFIVPVIYIQRTQQKGRQELLKGFMNLAGQEQLRISQHDEWSSRFAIGIDTERDTLLYLKKREAGDQTSLIGLSQVGRCEVVNTNREVSGNRVVDRIGLRFSFRDARRPDQTVEFYDREESLLLNGELGLAEKWKAVVDSRIQAPPLRDTYGMSRGAS